MASSIKLTNANGKVLTLSHQDTHNEDNTVDVLSTAYTIETINDFATVPAGFKTVIVKESGRGGTFVWSATGTANDGTVFAGATGYWNRQYDGAVNVKWFGAVGNGIVDDNLSISNAMTLTVTTKQDLLHPKGIYNRSGVAYIVDSDSIWKRGSYTGGVNATSSAQNSHLVITDETDTSVIIDGTKSRVGMNVTVSAKGAQHASGIRSNLTNYSTDGNGCTGFYGRATSDTSAMWSAAVHGETRHAGGTSIGLSSESASYSATGSLIGLVVNNTSTGAEATHPITGNPTVLHSTAKAIMIQGSNDVDPKGSWKTGISFETNSMRDGGDAILLNSTASLVSQIKTISTSYSSTADIFLQGNSSFGIITNGIYTNGALRISDNQLVILNSAGTVGIRHETAQGTSRTTVRSGITNVTGTAQAGATTTITLAVGSSAINNDPTYVGATIRITGGTGIGQNRTILSYDGATKVATVSAWTTIPNSTSTYSIRASTERVGFNVSATPSVWLNSSQVVGLRQTGWTAMTGTANIATSYDTSTITLIQLAERVKALQDSMITHGLIGA